MANAWTRNVSEREVLTTLKQGTINTKKSNLRWGVCQQCCAYDTPSVQLFSPMRNSWCAGSFHAQNLWWMQRLGCQRRMCRCASRHADQQPFC